jgi:hypothetical protein
MIGTTHVPAVYGAALIEAACGELEPDDPVMGMSDAQGQGTFAHDAARRGILPPGFDLWNLKASDGRTVREVWEANRK